MLSFLLQGEFLTRERVRLWSLFVLAATLLAVAWLGFTAHGLSDYRGRPLGTDFFCLYTAGDMARSGQADAAYDMARLNKAEQAAFGPTAPSYGWFYPPFFLFVAEALSNLPYIPALLVWLGGTLLAYVFALRALVRASPSPDLARDPLFLLVALAFPAVFVNLTHGQNGFLTAALITGGLALLKPRPFLAGILFGLLAYKPQLGIALPFALAAGRQWKAFGAAALTVLGLAGLATAAFGFPIWSAFAEASQLNRTLVIEQGLIGFEKIQSVFAAVRLLGGPVMAAYAAQGIVVVGALTALVMIWRSTASDALKGAALCFAVLLSTPYLVDYDLALLAPAIALMTAQARAQGFHKGEALLLAALWLMPLLARVFAHTTHVALMPFVVLAALVLVARRAHLAF